MLQESILKAAGAVALAMLIAGCTGPAEQKATLVGPVWGATAIGDKAVLADALITLQLDGAGHASGKGGCNSYNGPYTLAGSALSFGALASTKMACAAAAMDQEQTYFDALAGVTSYAVTGDGALVLTTSDGREIRYLRE